MVRRYAVAVGLGVAIVALALLLLRSRSDDASRDSNASGSAPSGRGIRVVPSAPARTASLSGRVTGASDGSGIADANVSVAATSNYIETWNPPTVVVTTDHDGRWSVPLAPGKYAVAATAIGFLPEARKRVVLVNGAHDKIDLALAVGGTTVHGVVTDANGGPIAGARVTAFAGPEFVALTGSDGTYQLTLQDGQFTISASHDDYTTEYRSVPLAAQPVALDFVLAPGGVIRGKVIERDTGNPLPNALVELRDAHAGYGQEHGSAISDNDGTFTIRGVPSGGFSIYAVGRGYASAAQMPIAVGIGEQIADVQVLVDRAFSISGRVVKKGPSQGIVGVQVRAFTSSALPDIYTIEPTDETGHFELVGLQPASYLLQVLGVNVIRATERAVEITDRDVDGVVLEMPAGVTIRGRVEPVGRVEIELVSNDELTSTSSVQTDVDATGGFVLRTVPSGKLTIYATAADGRAGKLPIVVTDSDQSGLVVALEPRASISGKVMDDQGAPVAGAVVSAKRRLATSGPDGSYKIFGLEPGKVSVLAYLDENSATFELHDPAHQPIEVEVVAGVERTSGTCQRG